MIAYAEKEVFSEREVGLLRLAEDLIRPVPHELDGQLVRCHELARAVGRCLDLEVEDGHFGFVEHSWLWTEPLRSKHEWRLPNVLDVYVPGSLPQVQLVDMVSGLPHRYSARQIKGLVIREDVVERLIEIMKR